jgi:hypothetical protein
MQEVGSPKPACPYCNFMLEEIPGRKKKCPACGHFIYVRTRPSDRQRILVTESQAKEIELQWNCSSSSISCLGRRATHGTDLDALWKEYNHQIVETASQMNWGLYRNILLDMTDVLIIEQRYSQALKKYLEICYIDLNGPNNLSGNFDPEIMRIFPQWTPGAFPNMLAPKVIEQISELITHCGFSDGEVEAMYLEVANQNQQNLHLPLSPAEAWPELNASIDNARNVNI